jgi:integrating conjugative element membrane protein (TIGR03747 family)
VLELAGLYFWWPHEGSRHVFQVMRQERAELVIALQPHPLGNEILVLLEKGTTRVLMANTLLQKPFTGLVYTLVSFMQRLIWLATMLPLLCLCAVTGLTEGLVRRDLRRFGSGLESVFLHRYVIRSGSLVATTIWVCYLAQPLFLPARLVLLPATIWFGITVWMVAGSFKRWL